MSIPIIEQEDIAKVMQEHGVTKEEAIQLLNFNPPLRVSIPRGKRVIVDEDGCFLRWEVIPVPEPNTPNVKRRR